MALQTGALALIMAILGVCAPAAAQPRLRVDEGHRVALAVSPWHQFSVSGRWLVTVRVYPHRDHAVLWVEWGTAALGLVGRSGMSLHGDRDAETIWSRRPIVGLPAGHYTITATVLDRTGHVCGTTHVEAIITEPDLEGLSAA